MNLNKEISKHIESIFEESAKTFSSYQLTKELPCLSGCGACCLSQEISASTSEMLPSAFRLLNDEGIERVEELLDELEGTPSKTCVFYHRNSEDGTKGFCMNYSTRPAVCRSFGVAAYRDKNGGKTMSICKRLKEAYPEEVKKLDPNDAPVIGDFAKQIYLLGQSSDAKLMHINEALYEALKKVWLGHTYDSSEDS
ncbi:YkgJ family cysteine cluster protein [Halobacteriovorax sp. RT-2-6]|uniref:YkgJ family cysteine cluster protein n=1 Tax=unclassified Halobacteriovorax TaxID=2639665 RepID=UPI0039999F78